MPFRKHTFETLASTQIYARELCDSGRAVVGDVVTCAEQTGGYGRRGRAWQSPRGNLYLTLIETFRSPADLAWIGYAMGLALYDAVAGVLPDAVALRLKWPNDLLLNDGKLSGLLLEVSGDKVLIGAGLNVSQAPESDQPVSALNDYVGVAVTPDVLLDRVLDAYAVWRAVGLTSGFAGMRAVWLERAAFIGRTITARLANGIVLKGIFHDLDPGGALVLQTDEGEKSVTAADIYLLGAPLQT